MLLGENGNLKKYNEWAWCVNDFNIDKLNFPTTGAGTLFPPNSLHKDATNDKLFLLLAPYADDVWFKAMSLLQGTLSRKVFTRSLRGEDYIDLDGEIQNETALGNINVVHNKNDEQIEAVFKHYNIYELL